MSWDIKAAKQQPLYPNIADAQRFMWDKLGKGAFVWGEEPAAERQVYP